MRASLARHGRYLVARSAASCSAYATPARRRPPPRSAPCGRRGPHRTFLGGIFQKPPREVRQPEYEPGWMQIMLWRSRMLENLRPPKRRELFIAWRSLVASKLRNRVPFNTTQALQCRRLLEYLANPPANVDADQFDANELSMTRQVLVDIEPYERSQHHLDLARALHAIWVSGKFTGKPRSTATQSSFLMRCMCEHGGALEACKSLDTKWAELESEDYITGKDQLLEVVARGLAREGREAELVKLIDFAESRGISYDPQLQNVMVTFFARKDRVAETQHWFAKPVQGVTQAQTYRELASFAARNHLQEWAMDRFLELGQSQPRKRHWDVLLQATLVLGKSLSEVNSMMPHLMHRTEELTPDVHTINGLLGVAVEMRDATLGDDILALAAERGIDPDGETHLILLELRLLTGDLVAAQAAYREVDYREPWTDHLRPDLFPFFRRLMSDYLSALCAQPRPDFKYISSLLESVEERQVRLEPATVGALCVRFLENDQQFDVMDLLAVHCFVYSEAERKAIQNALASFCLDASTSTGRAWGAYQILYQFFPDTNSQRRVELMEGFFGRKRPDMAAEVFGHMRAHANRVFHPSAETYIKCLEGFAQHPDAEGLAMVHNMLKMDVFVQPSTRLNTALMLAYTGCDRPLIALDLWHEITQSASGPTYETLEAVFWALERKPGGCNTARQIWDRMEKMEMEITPGVYNAYIGAVAGSGNEKEVKGLILKMAFNIGAEPDAKTLSIAYNALPGQQLQKSFEDWAKKRYSEIWSELLKIGRRMNEYGLCQFMMKRKLKA